MCLCLVLDIALVNSILPAVTSVEEGHPCMFSVVLVLVLVLC